MTLVPTVKNLLFYSNEEQQRARYQAVRDKFAATYGEPPAFFARAPGRVNLVGEHIDYCHFSVLPMAIEVDVIAAVAPAQGTTITIANTNPKFHTEEVHLPPDGKEVTIDLSHQLWGNYFKCGVIVAHKFIVETHPDLVDGGKKPLKAFNALFDGTVPDGGGLSSSAAFCIAATLSVLRANGVDEISKDDLTRITVVCEHYVGLSNGGMDQSASINGEEGKVLLVLFKPKLEAQPFALPATDPETVFLITNSLITANKTETAPTNYNLRVVEVAVAADLIARKLGLSVKQDSNLNTATLRGVFDAFFTQTLGEQVWDGKDLEMGIARLQRMLEVADKLFDKRAGYTTEEAADAVGLTGKAFREKYLSLFPVRYEVLNLYRRTRHVYSDALRVLQTLALARGFDGDSENYLDAFGRIMDESQVSTRDFNNASCDGCDDLCRLGKSYGARGSRVTGAGFGGCVVHLTTVDRLAGLVGALKEKYYRTNFAGITESELEAAIVVSKPAEGACIVSLG